MTATAEIDRADSDSRLLTPQFWPSPRPLYLAPMAGVTDSVFRRLCKEQGAEVMVTEFVSADGIMHRNSRTREMVDFRPEERPIGVQLFGADPSRLSEAAKSVVDWVQPDFIDLNFGCPVNKVVCKQGGSALLKDCPLLERVAASVVRGVSPTPVTAKIRIGWSPQTINAITTAKILEDCGVAAIAVHGRTKEQGYSGNADWEKIAEVAETVKIPVIGNGDIRSVEDICFRFQTTGVRALMIGRAAMISPWLFRQAQEYLRTGRILLEPSFEERWAHIIRHCRLAVEACPPLSPRRHRARARDYPLAGVTAQLGESRSPDPERFVLSSMRARLMAYTRGMPAGKMLRTEVQQVVALSQVEDLAARHLAWLDEGGPEPDSTLGANKSRIGQNG